jgi:alpha-D-xyloside xylohydrolase
MKVKHLLLSIAVCFVALASDAEQRSSTPRPELVAPGVWRLRFGKPEKNTPTHFRASAPDKAGLADETSRANFPFNLHQVSFRRSDRGCSLLLPMDAKEHIYGFGLITKFFDMTETAGEQTGRHIFLQPTDAPENDLGESHAPAPFYVSSKGYGVFVDTARFASFYTGNDAPAESNSEPDFDGGGTSVTQLYRTPVRRVKSMLADIPTAQGVDVYIFSGPTMRDAVERYNLFSGGGAVPPLWGLGVQYRGYTKFGAEESLALATTLRSDHMPCDVWGVEPGWQSKTYSCSFVWNSNQFPDPTAFLDRMHKMNYHMNFWEHAFTHPDAPIYAALKPWSGNYTVWHGLVPDFASPEGRTIFLRQNREALFDRGIEAVKLDECDYQPASPKPWSFPLVTAFPSGLDGEVMHSLFGLLYQEVMWQPLREKGLRTWGLVRNSHALAASLPYVLYSDSYDHRCYVRGLVNEGFSGLLWTPELRDAKSIEDMYRRLETVVFSADTVINSWYIKNPPWYQVDRAKNNLGQFMPERETVTANVRNLLQLRMRFIPYLYSAFNEYHRSGKPPIRALVLDWPHDTNLWQVDDEYMFGDSLLVAPIFAGEGSRQVYLPAGDWFDFWTREKIVGGRTIEISKPFEQIPLFVKSGTLLPLADPVESIQPDTQFDLTINIFGDHPSTFTLYEDDGVSDAFSKGEQNMLMLDAKTQTAKRSGQYHGPDRYKITAWKRF